MLALAALVLLYTTTLGSPVFVLIGVGSAALCGLVAWHLKQIAVRRTIDDCVAEAELAIARHSPAIILGYSWGGATATFCIERSIWRGPTLLLAPCGNMWAARIVGYWLS